MFPQLMTKSAIVKMNTVRQKLLKELFLLARFTCARRLCFAFLIMSVFLSACQSLLAVSGKVFGWGEAGTGSLYAPSDLTNAVSVAGAWTFAVALREDGNVTTWGQGSGPVALSNIVAIAAGQFHFLALTEAGQVSAWDSHGQIEVPNDLTNIVDISAGGGFDLALTSDGTVKAWSDEPLDVTVVPDNLSNVVAIAAGLQHGVALLSDGSVAAWGDNEFGQLDIPLDLTNVIKIAAGGHTSLALTREGKVFAWGYSRGTDDENPTIVPSDLADVVSISAGATHCMALTQEGNLAFWGDYSRSQAYPPSELTYVLSMSCGGYFNLGIGVAESPTWNLVLGNPRLTTSSFSAKIQTVRGRKYVLEWTDSLSSGVWTLTRPVWGNGQETTLTDKWEAGSQRFYRLVK